MHQTVQELVDELRRNMEATHDTWAAMGDGDVPAIVHQDMSMSHMSRVEVADVLATLIRDLELEVDGFPDLGAAASFVQQYTERLALLRGLHRGPIPGSQDVINLYMQQVENIRNLLQPWLSPKLEISEQQANVLELAKENKRLKTALATIARRIEHLDTTSQDFHDQVAAVRQAYDAAQKLDAELTDLQIERGTVQQISKDVAKTKAAVDAQLELCEIQNDQIKNILKRADSVLERSEAGYRAITSQGLAYAFQRRSLWASASVAAWTVGLLAALLYGGYQSKERMNELLAFSISDAASPLVLTLQASMMLLTTAGTVWFAWLASLQIGYRFRLAEDYAYKASVSTAYEGYRKEAERVDDGLARKLLASALDRLDEVPLRVVDPKVHGSPVQAVMDSDAVKQAAGILPGMLAKVLPGKAGAATDKSKSDGSTPPDDKH